MARQLALIALIALALGLGGCCLLREPEVRTITVTQRVDVPVPYRERLPAALRDYSGAPPPGLAFVSPSDPSSSSALTVNGEKSLRGYIDELRAYIEAVKAWDQPGGAEQ